MTFKSFHPSILLSLCLYLFSLSAFSQKTITGVVSDTLNQPLESANLIAKPLQENARIKLGKADNNKSTNNRFCQKK